MSCCCAHQYVCSYCESLKEWAKLTRSQKMTVILMQKILEEEECHSEEYIKEYIKISELLDEFKIDHADLPHYKKTRL